MPTQIRIPDSLDDVAGHAQLEKTPAGLMQVMQVYGCSRADPALLVGLTRMPVTSEMLLPFQQRLQAPSDFQDPQVRAQVDHELFPLLRCLGVDCFALRVVSTLHFLRLTLDPLHHSQARNGSTQVVALDNHGSTTRIIFKWFRQAKFTGKIHNEKAILLLDTGAEVSIVDTTFARKVGCSIDSSQIQDCVKIGDNVYQTEGIIQIKVTVAGSSVYFFDIWVGGLTGQQAILAHESIDLPDEVRIQLSGRRHLYNDKAKIVNSGQYLRIQTGESVGVTHGDRWVPTISDGPGRTKYTSITNIGDDVLILHQDQRIGIWLAGYHVPRLLGFISIGSRRYMEWQNLALEATTDARSEDVGLKPSQDTRGAIRQQNSACTTLNAKDDVDQAR
ncbi:hypothetical protein PHMEG_00015694 [Phytophthora megakarya]|uniref:Peptidase A2 domain-containing protein n=1 Tax=Phytophthora megakarya TaxID=4795 RepID=A0A225W0S9_9STRA|nr:hypothetical protein PHMEG_00015694 [Phytophthora megakarya]